MASPYVQDQSNEPKIKSTLITVAVLSIVVIGGGVIFQSINTSKNREENEQEEVELYNPLITSETAEKQIQPTVAPVVVQKRDLEILRSEIQELIKSNMPEGKEWIFGVVITDLATGDSTGINETEEFDAASVGKIPILLTIYDQIKNGIIKDTDEITIKASEIQDYGTGILRYRKAPMTLTVKELAELMIKKSDNTAAYVLASKAGRSNIKEFVAKIKMDSTDTIENTTTPADTDLSLRYLYNMQKSDPVTAGILTKMMTDSDFEQRLPAQLPEDVIIAHKIGTGVAQIHDAGIVLHDKHPYAISVFSKKVNDEKKAEEIIAKVSKATFEFFSQEQ